MQYVMLDWGGGVLTAAGWPLVGKGPPKSGVPLLLAGHGSPNFEPSMLNFSMYFKKTISLLTNLSNWFNSEEMTCPGATAELCKKVWNAGFYPVLMQHSSLQGTQATQRGSPHPEHNTLKQM